MKGELGDSCSVDRTAVAGYEHDRDAGPASIGARATVRANSGYRAPTIHRKVGADSQHSGDETPLITEKNNV